MKHGLSRTPEYAAWRNMIRRCTRSTCRDFGNYGGRGVRVCPSWRRDFLRFYADMGPRPLGTSLDRRNVDGNYSRRNCRWATADVQARNKRPRRPGARSPSKRQVERQRAEGALVPLYARVHGALVEAMGRSWVDRACGY